MNDHYLDAVRRLAPVAPVPSAAVLAAAMATAGLHPTGSPVACPEPATDPTTDPLLLQPRHPRRTRRRMVSLTVALATTGVAAAVVGALLVVSGERRMCRAPRRSANPVAER